MDKACTICGRQPATYEMVWQGHPTVFCYDCWDELVGADEEVAEEEDWQGE